MSFVECDRDELILEGIVTTKNEDGSTNVSPMGPVVDRDVTKLRLRPFQTSATYLNLKRMGQGVFHVTDDVEMLALAAIGKLSEPPSVRNCDAVDGQILKDACRWYAFEVISLDDTQERTELECRIVASGRLRDFVGWNRAQHAVLEAAILATRVHLLPRDDIISQLEHLAVIVDKTAGLVERRAFKIVCNYVEAAT